MSVIDEVRQKTDIVEVVSQYTKLTKTGRTFRALCPFHSEKHPSFFVYPEQQNWHCFGACNTGGDVFSFVIRKQSISFGEALRFLAERSSVTLSPGVPAETTSKEKETLCQINLVATQFYSLILNSSAGEKARNYLTSRGLLPKTINDFQLGYSPKDWEALKQHLMEKGYTENELVTTGLIAKSESGEGYDYFRNKLMFPIYDIRGHVTGFGARVLDESLPKYINSPQTLTFDKSSSLYGINLASTAVRQQDQAVIVEGYMDVLTAFQNGFTNVVASMGTSITEKHINILKRLTKNITLALDADAAGEEAMLRGVGYENTLDAEVKVIVLPSGKDPDDVIKEDVKLWQKLEAEALTVLDYTFKMTAAKFDLATAKGKSLVADKLLPMIAEIKNDIRRDHYLQKLAVLLDMSYNKVETALSRIRPARNMKEPREQTAPGLAYPIISSPVEEYCLALLLQHPELKPSTKELLADYFESSENREIYIAWQKADGLTTLNKGLDPFLQEKVELLITKRLPSTKIEQRYADCAHGLQEEFLRKLEAKKEAVLTSEAKAGGTNAELAKLKEQGIDASIQLRKLFHLKKRGG